MTIRSLINFDSTLSLAVGINLRVRDDARMDISLAIIRRKNDTLSIVKQQNEISSVSDLIVLLRSEVPSGTRLHLNIEGKGILVKDFDPARAQNDLPLIKRLFPMAKPDDFVSQVYEKNGIGFLSLLRSEVVHAFTEITPYFSIGSVTLGVFIISSILPLIEEDTLDIQGYRILVNNHLIMAVSPMDNNFTPPIRIGSELMKTDAVLAYASACSIFLGLHNITTVDLPWINESKNTFLFRKNLFRFSKVALMALLVILILNGGVYVWVQSKMQTAKGIEKLYVGKLKEIDHKKEQLTVLITAFESAGWASNVMPVYYADQLAILIGKDVSLKSLEIGVPDNEILKKERRLDYQPGVIKVRGVAENPVALQNLILSVKRYSWVEKVVNQLYQHDKRSNTGIFEFYIYIK